jgi:hypothetical protein
MAGGDQLPDSKATRLSPGEKTPEKLTFSDIFGHFE